ncbi:MAG TPA: hypothetical protein VK889_08390 [Solirubrobacterales bacterium]|nr:hypothetical protein [Solirubrobacterales bacterium]
MPWLWKVGMAILVVCLMASMVIAIVRLSTTPTEVLGGDFQGLSEQQAEEWARGER